MRHQKRTLTFSLLRKVGGPIGVAATPGAPYLGFESAAFRFIRRQPGSKRGTSAAAEASPIPESGHNARQASGV